MQTRRDQLQAYRFQNRRALAALVTGEPNVVDPPMRRLTVTTLSGLMIAVLVTVGFTVFGLIKPKAGDSWKEAGSIIVENDTGATYVYLNGTLHPVVNYSSAVLAVGGNQRAKIVEVDTEDIAGAKRGPQLGITGLPSSLPAEDKLVRSPFAACSREQTVAANQVGIRVGVAVGSTAGSRTLPASAGVLVDTGQGSQSYLLYDGHRLAIAAGRTATSLGLTDRDPLPVGRAFLNAIPQGPALQAPTNLPNLGKPASLDGVSAVVGQLIKTSAGRYFVAMADGVASVNPVQQALLATLPIGPGGTLLEPASAPQSAVLDLPTSSQWQRVAAGALAGLPATVPTIDASAGTNGGVCAVFTNGSDEPRFAVPPSALPSFQATNVRESALSERGLADKVTVQPGRAALVTTGGTGTVFLIGDSGRKFAATDRAVLAGFGYTAGDAATLPAALLALIPTGPALSPSEARRTVSG